MTTRRILKLLHAASTGWFVIATGYIFVLTLREAGVRTWLIYSLSGQSAALLFLLVSAYLFAVFRGSSRHLASDIEHPLTSSRQYMAFYSLMPFLGGIAGAICMYDSESFEQIFVAAVLGTLGCTFVLWIIVDPIIAITETLLPAGRAHRIARIEAAKAERLAIQNRHDELFAQIESQEAANRQMWKDWLETNSAALVDLAGNAIQKSTAGRIIELGLEAWKLGGNDCMTCLFEMTTRNDSRAGEYISSLWDGIGNWKHNRKSLCLDKP